MPDEAITLIRASSAVDGRALPDVPAGFRGAPVSMRLQHVEWVAENDRAELVRAADELDARRDSVAADLGRHAPEADARCALRERVVGTDGAITCLEALLSAAKQQHEVALSDLSRMVRRAAERVPLPRLRLASQRDHRRGHGAQPPPARGRHRRREGDHALRERQARGGRRGRQARGLTDTRDAPPDRGGDGTLLPRSGGRLFRAGPEE